MMAALDAVSAAATACVPPEIARELFDKTGSSCGPVRPDASRGSRSAGPSWTVNSEPPMIDLNHDRAANDGRAGTDSGGKDESGDDGRADDVGGTGDHGGDGVPPI